MGSRSSIHYSRDTPPAHLHNTAMKCQLVACLALLVVANGLPTRFQLNFPRFVQPSTATGNSNAAITSGQQLGPLGSSTITQSGAQTGGQATGLGLNQGTASATQGSQTGLFGNANFGNVDSTSVQKTQGGLVIPGFPSFPSIPGFGGTATGGASSSLTQGKTQGPGGVSTVTSLSSSAEGSATNGGSSTNAASGSTSSTDGFLGSSQQSNNQAISVQTGR